MIYFYQSSVSESIEFNQSIVFKFGKRTELNNNIELLIEKNCIFLFFI
jgi:hypothetical protein